MNNIFRLLVSRYKSRRLRRYVAKHYGLSISEIIDAVTIKLSRECSETISRSEYRNLGGVNNMGILLHYNSSEHPFALTKLQSAVFAEREWRFQRWQEDHCKSVLAPNAYAYGLFPGKVFGWVTSEYLLNIKAHEAEKIVSLYNLLDVDPDNLKSLSLSGSFDKLPDEIIPDTKIKSILTYLVSGTGDDECVRFMRQYLSDRNYLLRSLLSNDDVTNLIAGIFPTSGITLGLVHGDFKHQNIMKSRTGELKIIDLQYYTYGRRIWDIAFYASKDNGSIYSWFNLLDETGSLSRSDLELFLMYYLVAAIINVKKKRSQSVIERKLRPCVELIRVEGVLK